MQFKGHGPPSSSLVYDEQIGLTFTQSFTSMEYNVTAVEQTDPTLGDGPAYLLNGVSNTGYWYQVGLSWNWSPGENPGTGFAMSYEVFDGSGNSIFPTNGQGGLDSFSGPVNAGDVILLNLYFSSSSKNVVMLAEDTNTGAVATEVYPKMGATYFVGLPNSLANPNGFFTGLMTEWYHGTQYFNNEAEVIYSDYTHALPSAWMWMDEFNAQTFQEVFSANTSAPVSYSDPNKLQEFAFNGTTEYSDAYEFITGSLTNSTQPTSSEISLTLSFALERGGTAYSPPTLTYFSNGVLSTAALTASPTIYEADIGTSWSVSALLNGSTSVERWATNQTSSGVALSNLTEQFVYYHQENVTFDSSVSGGGSGFSPPTVTYSSFGLPATTPTDFAVWADAGSKYEYPNLLPGSTTAERWYTKLAGSIGSSQQIDATYYHQYLVEFDITFQNTGLFPSLPLSSMSIGEPYSARVVVGTNEKWLDSGSNYSVSQSFSLGSRDRMATSGPWTGFVSANLVVPLTYEQQFYIVINSEALAGGSTSPPSGWYNAGSRIGLSAEAASGWQLEGWDGVGVDSVSTSNASFYLTVGPSAPANETALFYPGIMINADGPMPVSYSDGSVSGTVPPGARAEVYVPPSSTLRLTTSSVSLWTTVRGWSGIVNSTATSASFVVESPATVTLNSQYNYSGIGFLALAVALFAVVGIFALSKYRQSREHRGGALPEPTVATRTFKTLLS
jgi:hypothetical protein